MDALRHMGFEAVLEVSDPQKSISYAMEHAHELVAEAVQEFLGQKNKKILLNSNRSDLLLYNSEVP